MAREGYENAGDDAEEGDCEDVGKVADAGGGGRGVFDRLEVDGEVVNQDEEARAVEECVEGLEGEGFLPEEPGDHEGAIGHPEFVNDEEDGKDAGEGEAGYDGCGRPRACCAAPLKREQEADHGD